MLILIYQNLIVELYNNDVLSFGYYGYPLGTFKIIKFIFVSFIIVIINFNLPKFICRPSDLIINLYYYLVTLPFMALFSLNFYNDIGGIIGLSSFLILFILYNLFFLRTQLNIRKILYFSYNKFFNRKLLIVILLSIFIVIIFILKMGIHTKIDSLLDVYSQRKIFNNSGILVQIVFSFLSFGFIPYYIFLYFDTNKYFYLILTIIFTIIDFIYSGSKMILFGVFFTFFIGFFMKKKILTTFIVGCFILSTIIFSFLCFYFFKIDLLLSLFIRRSMILVAQIYGLYFDYFTNHSFNFLSKYTHFLGFLDEIKSASHIIGERFFLKNTHANSGILSDAYGNFGIIGILFYILFLFFIFKILNSLNKKYKGFITFLVFPLAISLTNSGVLAVFVYQIFPFLIVFYFFRKG